MNIDKQTIVILESVDVNEFRQEVIFMPIPGLEERYSASSDGRIWSNIRNQIMKPSLSNGYLQINLCMHGKKKRVCIHRLVAQTWIINTENLPQVNHINGIKTDNRVENLEWSDARMQRLHAIRIGLVKTTQSLRDSARRNGKLRRKLTIDDANAIRNLNMSHAKIASLYGVSKRCIQFIKNGETYVTE